jgi:hypothetical protein
MLFPHSLSQKKPVFLQQGKAAFFAQSTDTIHDPARKIKRWKKHEKKAGIYPKERRSQNKSCPSAKMGRSRDAPPFAILKDGDRLCRKGNTRSKAS